MSRNSSRSKHIKASTYNKAWLDNTTSILMASFWQNCSHTGGATGSIDIGSKLCKYQQDIL